MSTHILPFLGVPLYHPLGGGTAVQWQNLPQK